MKNFLSRYINELVTAENRLSELQSSCEQNLINGVSLSSPSVLEKSRLLDETIAKIMVMRDSVDFFLCANHKTDEGQTLYSN